AAAREVGWGHENSGLRLELLRDVAQRFERGLDDFALTKALLRDLTGSQKRELEALRCLAAPTAHGARPGDRHVRLLHFDEEVFFEMAGGWNGETSAANDHHDWVGR